MVTSCNQMYPRVRLMCFSFLPALPTCPTFTYFHLGNHFSWATGKLTIWSPDTTCLEFYCADSSPHTPYCFSLWTFASAALFAWDVLSFPLPPPTPSMHWLNAVRKTEPNTGLWGRLPGGNVPHLRSHPTQ